MDDVFFANYRQAVEVLPEFERVYPIIRTHNHQIQLHFTDDDGNDLPIDPKYAKLLTELNVAPAEGDEQKEKEILEAYRKTILEALRELSPGEIPTELPAIIEPAAPPIRELSVGAKRNTYRRKKSKSRK